VLTGPLLSLSHFGLNKELNTSTNLLSQMEEVCIDEDGWVAKREPFAVAITKMEKVRKNIQTYIAYDVKSDVSHLHFAPIPTTPITPAFLCWSAVPKILVLVCVGGGDFSPSQFPLLFWTCPNRVPLPSPFWCQLSPNVVSRRYKHFEWLQQRLMEKYPFVVVPVLPDKQVQGRFEAEFIQQRKKKLERFLGRIVAHPILRNSVIFHHFLTTSDTKDWKEGKRAAEMLSMPTALLDAIKLQTPPRDDTWVPLPPSLTFISLLSSFQSLPLILSRH